MFSPNHILDIFKGDRRAQRVQYHHDVQRDAERGGFHWFVSARGSTVADLRDIRMLVEKTTPELLRIGKSGEGDSLRQVCEVIVAFAKELGLYIEASSWPGFGQLKSKRSGESAVYLDESRGVFVKVKNPASKQAIKRTAPADFLFEHIAHNALFPNSRYVFRGITEEFHEIRIVLEQNAIRTIRRPTDAQIADYLQAEIGLVPEGRYFFANEVLAVTDVGRHSDNVLLGGNGELYFIDPLIQLRKPAVAAIDFLEGDFQEGGK